MMKLNRNILFLSLITVFQGCGFQRLVERVEPRVERTTTRMFSFIRKVPDRIEYRLRPNKGILMGKILNESMERQPVVVITFSTGDSQKKPVDYTILTQPAPYALYVPEGKYYVFAYIDLNENWLYDKNELVGQYGKPDIVSVSAGQIVRDLNILVSSRSYVQRNFSVDLKIPRYKEQKKVRSEVGGIVNLDDEIFSKKYGTLGLWSPVEFMETVGTNIYFLEKYDKTKIPVLFIHGAGGTPKDWEFFVKKIDRQHYQPWFFYYPAGLRSKAITELLYERLKALSDKYKFECFYVTAHSLGGLIGRALINQYDFEKDRCYPGLFVSISTPWGGSREARLALKYAPSYIPYWEDVAEGSKFIENVFSKKMPPKILFYLFFGKKGGSRLIKGDDDGKISLSSALDPRAKSETTEIYGFDEDHLSILFSEGVLSTYNVLLNNVRKQTL